MSLPTFEVYNDYVNSVMINGIGSLNAIVRNRTICWEEQPQATLESLFVPVLKIVNTMYDEKKKGTVYMQGYYKGRFDQIFESICTQNENQKHNKAIADFIWQAMDDVEQYPNLEKYFLNQAWQHENLFERLCQG